MQRRKSAAIALAAWAIASTFALAQPAPSGPPLESQRPPGFNPAPPSAAQQARPPSGPPEAAARLPEPEWLVTRNSADTPAWVSIAVGRLVLQAGCVKTNSEERWAITDRNKPFTV